MYGDSDGNLQHITWHTLWVKGYRACGCLMKFKYSQPVDRECMGIAMGIYSTSHGTLCGWKGIEPAAVWWSSNTPNPLIGNVWCLRWEFTARHMAHFVGERVSSLRLFHYDSFLWNSTPVLIHGITPVGEGRGLCISPHRELQNNYVKLLKLVLVQTLEKSSKTANFEFSVVSQGNL